MLSKHVLSLQSLANLNGIKLTIETGFLDPPEQKLDYKYITEFVLLISRIIELAQKNSKVIVYPNCHIKNNRKYWSSVECHGISGNLPETLTQGLEVEFATEFLNGSTRIDVLSPIEQSTALPGKTTSPRSLKPVRIFKPFYQQFRKQLKSHLTSIKSLQERADEMSSEEGEFLRQLNHEILANLDNSKFDTHALCRSLTISRPLLYRKLKPLIGLSPAAYIRFVRLTKAKEMLENTNQRIGDIAFELGYSDQSHFTRAFKNQFGYHPSYYRDKCKAPKRINRSNLKTT